MMQATQEITAEYQRIYAAAPGDPGTAGDEGEENWAQLFRDWLPSNYHVATKGQILAPDGRLSPQVDVVVLEPGYPRKLREKRKWMAGGVVAAFECKTTLTAAHLMSSVSRCVNFKRLYGVREGTPLAELTSPLIYGLLAHSHSWKGENSQPIVNIEKALDRQSHTVDHPRHLIDFVCVADLATWAYSYQSWVRATQFGEEWTDYLSRAFAGPVGVTTTRFRYDSAMNSDESFTPLGVLIAGIFRRISLNDNSLRQLASYFHIVSGNGTGFQQPWSLDVYSPETRDGVISGKITNGWPGEDPWAGWAMSGP
ncbi:MAG: hypothetical protein IIZ30_11290 [Sphingomonas sp.]|uniref:DUF6602 domain-containing protein n=1 Tax=Sphingomonas sp. TaxID=28214 RepID=UPI00257C8732|nr:DUF6602 domain-containing protein [Sphingomonas sp.]MBQ1480610.1 hypothetical protein [Sphingomonas sp.]